MSANDVAQRIWRGRRVVAGLVAAVAVLLVVEPAGAEIRALDYMAARPGAGPSDAALAGDEALVARSQGRVLRVLAVPLAGGRAVERLRFTTRGGALVSVDIDASATAAGVVAGFGIVRHRFAFQPFVGLPAGPIAQLGPAVESDGRMPYADDVQVDGDVVTFTEAAAFEADVRSGGLSIREPGAAPVRIALPAGAISPVVAGELVAFALPPEGSDGLATAERLVVLRWRTGELVREVVVSGGISSLDLRADGSAVVGEYRTGILEVAPDGSQRRLDHRGRSPAYAGDSIVFIRQSSALEFDRLAVSGADRRVRPFGPRSTSIYRVATDETRVVWVSQGCVLTAELDDPAPAGGPAGPCPRSEIEVPSKDLRVARGRVPVEILCIAAAPAGCRGRVVLESARPATLPIGTARVRIPAGQRRTIRVALSARGIRIARRAARAKRTFAIEARATVVDPAGLGMVDRQSYAVEPER